LPYEIRQIAGHFRTFFDDILHAFLAPFFSSFAITFAPVFAST